jgi:twitching motility protein PilT
VWTVRHGFVPASDTGLGVRLKRRATPADQHLVDLNAVLGRAVELGASDIHLKVGQPPVLRRDGDLGLLPDHAPLYDSDLEAALATIADMSPAKLSHFHETGELDIAYAADGLPRFRVNGYRQRGSISFAFRVIPNEVPSFSHLRLPKGVQRLSEEHRGLVLVTGATGSGKTTTLAAVIDYINRTRRQHIVTIEDPIEILHSDHGCIVNQREVGLDTESFLAAIRRVLRQDPDVILIGELRDAETAETALKAAESGHLVFSTMHTIDAAETIGRMVEFFPATKQDQIRSILAGVLRGVISQRLLPRQESGRVAAVEVMVNNSRIADLIRESRTEEITDAIAEGQFFDMQTFSQALIELVLAGEVDRETAANASTNRHDFLVALDQALKRKAAGVVNDRPVSEAEPKPPKPSEQPLPGLRIAGAEDR